MLKRISESKIKTIFLDKSFLFSAKASDFHRLANTNRFAICDASLYELIKTPEPERTNCLKKFGPGVTEITLVANAGAILRSEIVNLKQAPLPSEFREKGFLTFNPKLFDGTYSLPLDLEPFVLMKAEEIRAEVVAAKDRAESIPSFFAKVKPGAKNEKLNAEMAIAEPGALLEMYSKFEWPIAGQRLPPTSLVTNSWAIYRCLQIQMLFALDQYFRYFGTKTSITDEALLIKIEHDVLDAEQLLLGCLEGSFATCEKKLKNWFKLLCPEGELLTT